MKKTFIEKYSQIFGSLGKRFIACAIITAIGAALCVLFLPAGVPLVYFGGFGMVSVFEGRKTHLVGSVKVRGNDKKEISCAIIRQRHYAYMPIIPIVCPFFYIPCKVQYYLIKNVVAPAVEKPERINNIILGSEIFEETPICVAEYKELISNPDSFYEKISFDIRKEKEEFSKDMASFVKTGLMEMVCELDTVSVYRIADAYILFHYSKGSAGQCGLVIDEELLEAVKKDEEGLFKAYIDVPRIFQNTVELSRTALERMLNAKELKDQINTEAAQRVMTEIDGEKVPITKEMIAFDLKWKYVTRKMIWGIFWSLLAILFIVSGPLGGLVTILMFSVGGGAFAGYMGVSFFVELVKNKKILKDGRYTIVRVQCTDVEENTDDEGTYYTCVFENGERMSGTESACIKGDLYYFVYPNGMKNSELHYNGLKFAPAPELTAVDYKYFNKEAVSPKS